jgi:8-hydroxy-5-deazaflavin:NADPH oxidoreductase
VSFLRRLRSHRSVPDLAKEYGPKFANKIVIDPANAVARRDGEELVTGPRKRVFVSPQNRILKARMSFNSMSYTNFAEEAHRSGNLMAIPMAGDDPHAIDVASQLVLDAGFDPVVVPLRRAQEFAQGGRFMDSN